MNRIITLRENARVFENVGGSLMGKTGLYIEAGRKVTIGQEKLFCFDHNDHLFVPFWAETTKYYFLKREIESSLPQIIN
jgi:hypothetical protein